MIRFFFYFLLFLINISASAYFEAKEIKTPKGYTVWYYKDTQTPVISISLSIAKSFEQTSANESKLSILLNLLSQGDQDFQNKLEISGTKINFESKRDFIICNVLMLQKNKQVAFDLFKESITRNHFSKNDFNLIKKDALSANRIDQENADKVAYQHLQKNIYNKTDYEFIDNINNQELENISFDDVTTFYKKFFLSNDIRIFVVGNIEESELARNIDTLFDKKSENQPFGNQQILAKNTSHISHISFPAEQSTIVFAQSLPKLSLKEIAALNLILQVHTRGTASTLNRNTRLKGLAYSNTASLHIYPRNTQIVGTIGTDKKNTEIVINNVKKIWSEIKEKGVSAQELALAKNFLIKSFWLRFKNSSDVSNALLNYSLLGFPKDYISKRSDIINAVTLEEVNDIVSKFFSLETLTFVVVGK